MRFGDLVRDVEPEPETIAIFSRGVAVEGLEQILQGDGRDGIARVGYREFENRVVVEGPDANGFVGRAVDQRIVKQVGEHLSDAASVAIDGFV